MTHKKKILLKNVILDVTINLTKIRKQNADDAYNVQIPFTIRIPRQLQIRRQFKLTILLYFNFYSGIPQIVRDSANNVTDSTKFPILEQQFERYSVLSICLRNRKKSRRSN